MTANALATPTTRPSASTDKIRPQNFPEQVIWYYVVGTYVLFFMGAPFIAAPLVGWALTAYLAYKWWAQTDATPEEERIRIPLGVWVWIVCMSVICLALIMGHLSFDFGLSRIIKSFINFFMRTWALLAIFPLVGCLNIRPELLYRAVCLLGLQSLVMVPLAMAMNAAGVQMPLYTVGILAKIGGLGDRYYNVSLYFTDESGANRLTLMAPWAPALALVATVYFWLSTGESNRRLRWLSMLANALMIWTSGSRLGLFCLIVLPVLRFFLIRWSNPKVQLSTGAALFFGGMFSGEILRALNNFKIQFDNQRASSSRVRNLLGRMARYRWQEHPIWGHTLKEKGPEVVREMPIGSHHTWYGAIYTHGLVGISALGVAVVYTLIELSLKAQTCKIAQVALMVFMGLLAFSFGENLEGLAYLHWPGLVLIGIAMKQRPKPILAHVTE